MWSTANELVQIPNKNEIRTRLEEFQKRFHQMRQEQEQSSPVPRTRKVKSVQPLVRRPRTLQVPFPFTNSEWPSLSLRSGHLPYINHLWRISHYWYYSSCFTVFVCWSQAHRRRSLLGYRLHKQSWRHAVALDGDHSRTMVCHTHHWTHRTLSTVCKKLVTESWSYDNW